MAAQRILVMGDNHGNVESLRRVVRETEGEQFDFIIHVGDILQNRDDLDKLDDIEPHFETLSERGRLVYIWGNRTDYGAAVPDDALDPGVCLDVDETRVIDGQRFSTDPEDITDETILVTHDFHIPLVDHFGGRVYFAGDVHVGRYTGRVLNAGFLYRDRGRIFGGFFDVEVTDEPPFDLEFHNIGGIRRIVCGDHLERGVLYQPHFHDCQFCHYEWKLEREMALSAHYGLTHETDDDVSRDTLYEYALEHFDRVPNGFADSFAEYLEQIPSPPTGRDLDAMRQWTRRGQ